jgi:hypothetical protein
MKEFVMKTKKFAKRGQEDPVRIDLMDHDHTDWHKVLASLDQRGVRNQLMLQDGFLSARQSLFVARAGETVVGHLCFHVAPLPAKHSEGHGVEARLDVLDIRPGFGSEEVRGEVRDLLVVAAKKRASLLRCAGVVGLGTG